MERTQKRGGIWSRLATILCLPEPVDCIGWLLRLRKEVKSIPMYFKGVQLDESIVLGWTLTDDLEISMEIALDSSHALYEPPIPGERACFKPGILKFPNASAVQGLLSQDEVTPCGSDDGPDFDTFHTLVSREGGYYVEGEFGEVTLQSSVPVLCFGDAFIQPMMSGE